MSWTDFLFGLIAGVLLFGALAPWIFASTIGKARMYEALYKQALDSVRRAASGPRAEP